MDGLTTLLLFGAFFYLMMRFGCGAHAVHGKRGGGDVKPVDPVCGMQVDVEQGYGKMHEGRLFRFCSRSCLDKFEAEPDRYLKMGAERNGGGA